MAKKTTPIGDIKILDIKISASGIIITALIQTSDNK